MRRAALLLLLGACDRVLGLQPIPAIDAEQIGPSCASTLTPGDYSMHAIVFANQGAPSLTGDQQLIYVAAGGVIDYATYGAAWSQPAPVGSLSDPSYFIDWPSLSYDGQQIFVSRHLTTGGYDLPFTAQRASADAQTWGSLSPVTFPTVLAGNDVVFGIPTTDGVRVVASHGFSGHYHLAELVMRKGEWAVADTTTALYPSNGDVSDTHPQLSPDGCWLVFARIDRAVNMSDHDVWLALRGADGTFAAPQRLFTNVSMQNEQHPWLSPDGTTLYFYEGNAGTPTTYVARRQ